MGEVSMFKKTMLLVAKLLGASVVWVALVSIIAVALTGRAVGAMTGTPAMTSEDGVPSRAGDTKPAGVSKNSTPSASKPNG
jgi:hypothetical protein